ncbi:MAG: lipocalin-like domain-containing protein [Pseudomonadota bacterium]|nr:lipocalin-like domain-containing protein [Pseudomonadota bacterium]
MNSRIALIAILAAAVLSGGAYLFVHHVRRAPPVSSASTTIDLLAEVVGSDAFERADAVRAFHFPRDHGLHEAFRTEWWYFTGHLTDAEQQPYGFQFTLFRFELDDVESASESEWRTPRVFLGHFAISDICSGKFHQFERMSRAFPGIAGASIDPQAVWLDDWRVEFDGHAHWSLHAQHDVVELELTLAALTPVVARGEGGLSRKSAAHGNASYYYSIPRLHARGALRLPSGEHAVEGTAWLDREWSTSALDREQVGWDWFALQFEDSSTLMFYRLRRRDGTPDPYSAGSYISAAGEVRALSADDVRIEVESTWTSAATGTEYPGAWQIEVEALELSISVVPRVAAQEWQGRFRYWEGAASFTGTRGSTAVVGLAYVELTGY